MDRDRLNSRWIGKFLSKHEGRIERGYRADQVGSRQGVALWSVGFVGFVGCAVRTRKKCQNDHLEIKPDDSFTESAWPDPQNPPNPPDGHAHEHLGACALGDRRIQPDSGYSAASSCAHLHNACVDQAAQPASDQTASRPICEIGQAEANGVDCVRQPKDGADSCVAKTLI